VGADGKQLRNGLQGPEYMRRMRILVRRAGVRILDHSPVTELLVDAAGAVAGAVGYRRQERQENRVRAGAVLLATGGCAFQSKALGCDVNTGDGALFAVEAGPELSGMEFSNAYGIAPEGTSVTKTAFYHFATFYCADGSVLEGASGQQRSPIARELLRGKVFCRLDRADADAQAAMRRAQPNFFLTFDRMGVNPFTDKFPVTLLAEGTVRGTGGIRIAGDDCATTVRFVCGRRRRDPRVDLRRLYRRRQSQCRVGDFVGYVGWSGGRAPRPGAGHRRRRPSIVRCRRRRITAQRCSSVR
jgi:succinate dehydrogenase/fumarate reductase flavoprotein subunit